MTERDRWSDALDIVEQVPCNPSRYGQHLDIRIVGPSLSITLLSLDDFKELVRRARLAHGEATPQAFIDAKKERDDGWPDDRI